jgi:hypothetical protein
MIQTVICDLLKIQYPIGSADWVVATRAQSSWRR